MTMPQASSKTSLQVRRTFPASRERVFAAWTNPENVREWWGAGDDFVRPAPVVEIDLREGGSYRLGMLAKDAEQPYVATGTFREVRPPEKLVYTWSWEHEAAAAAAAQGRESLAQVQETVVTVEFFDRGGSTEVVLTHESFPNEDEAAQHTQGWNGVLEQLAKYVS
jgi:uncharacterized protein YndB with AHSA1/START domain